MNSEQSLTSLTENQLRDIAYKVLENAINELKQNQHSTKEWMNLKEGSIYAGVAVNTFNKFILRGLRISVIGAVKRVSKTEIDNFLNKHSY
ncbi:DNA-binding protein [Psychrobacillus sp. FSL H8-0487]|uniref:DNA-binding protein n=1 Tax=Psychrobacillus sp. FSL H8-0487 TaxID=2921391 RepID=UPI0030F85132